MKGQLNNMKLLVGVCLVSCYSHGVGPGQKTESRV